MDYNVKKLEFMKVICIKDDYTTYEHTSTYKPRTTIGKKYELIQYDSYGDIGYYFIDDYGEEFTTRPIYFEKYFVSIEKWRELQLNKIGI